MSDIEDRVRSVLRAVVPAEPDTQGLAAGALRYYRRARRFRLAGALLAALAILAVLTILVGLLNPPAQATRADPMGTPSHCTTKGQPTTPSNAESATPAPVLAAWICQDPAGPADGEGWQLPAAALTGQHAENLDALISPPIPSRGPRSPGTLEPGCSPVVPGPAYTLTVQPAHGPNVTYRSKDLSCGGADLLAYFLGALADQDADDHAAAAPDEALPCRTDRDWTQRHQVVPLDSTFVTARMCFAPRYRSGDPDKFIQPMVTRSYQSAMIPPETLAMLNQDMISSSTGTYAGNGACYGEGAWVYSIVGLTYSGQYKMLATGCLDELWVVGVSRKGFIPSPATTTALRALVPPG